MAELNVGDVARLDIQVRDLDATGSPWTDPATLVVKVLRPSGEVDTYSVADAHVVRDTTGGYHLDYALTEVGWHAAQVASTEPNKVERHNFLVYGDSRFG